MAHIYRLIFLTLFLIAKPAFAQWTLSDGKWYVVQFGNGGAGAGSSAIIACRAAAQAGYPAYASSAAVVDGRCRVYTATGSQLASATVTSYNSKTTSYGGIYCPSGQYYSPDFTTCATSPPPQCPSSGTSYGESSVSVPVGSFPETATGVDSNGCVITVQCTMVVEYDGSRDCVGNATFTGDSGTGAPSGSFTNEQIEKAKEGYCQGEVNGTTVYVPCTNVTQQTDSATKTNSDGSTSTTKTSTSCTDGKCTTTETTTSTDSQGNVTASGSTKTESQSDFCQTNPGHAACKAGTFGGSCEAGFKCDGDAIQCAMAKVQHENKCALTPAPNAGAAYFDALTEGMPTNPNSGTVTVGSSMFNTSNLLGASSCTLDKSITVWGTTINLPFSQVCTALAYMGTLLQAVGFLLGARIITRG